MEGLLIFLGAFGILLSELVFILISGRKLPGEDQRANELLRAVLSPEEYHQLAQQGYLDITSPGHPQRVYRVPRCPGHVQVREPEKPTAWLCLQPLEWVPDEDRVVIHKLMIEADEETYLQTANHLIAISY